MMRNFLRRLPVLPGLVMALAAGNPLGAETLSDTLVLAYRNSHLLEQNQAVLRAADEDVASAISSLRPVFSYVLQSGYTKTAQADGTASALTLQGKVPLFDFGRNRLSIESAKETVLATREALVGIEQNVLLSAITAYFNVRSAVENVSINENSVSVIGEALKAAKDRFDVGEVTQTDVAQAEAQLASARAALASAQGQLALARESYKAATGRYPGMLAAAPKMPNLPRSLDEAKAIAERNHPSVLQAQHQVKALETNVEAAAAERMPDVTAGANVTTDGTTTTGQLGLSMTQTIYAGGALSSAHRKAIAGRDATKAGLLQTVVLIQQQVGNAWSNIMVSRAQIDATDRQIRAATVAFRGVKEEANLGAKTTLDVLNAEQSLLDAQATRIAAEANLQIANYSLLASMGLLTVDRLHLGIPTYDPSAYYNAVKGAPVTSVQGKSLDRVLKAIGKN